MSETEFLTADELVVLAGVFFWFNLNALAYLVGAGMAAYAFRDLFKA